MFVFGVVLVAGVGTAHTAASSGSLSGSNIKDCIAQLAEPGWCEIRIDATQVFRTTGNDIGVVGAKAAWTAWNGAAIDYPKMWFHGGGHNDSGMIDVYELDLEAGTLARIYTPPPFNVLYHKDNDSTKYAWRHKSSLPESTHTYDGIMYDPETGLILVVTGYGYTYGYKDMPDQDPDAPNVTTEKGRGIYAFNPTDTTIKNVAPFSWRRVSKRDLGGYVNSEYHSGTYLVGNLTNHYRAKWVGNDFVVDDVPVIKGSKSYPPMIKSIDGILYRRNNHNTELYGARLEKLGAVKNSGAYKKHGYSIAKYKDSIIHWDGGWGISTLSPDGEWAVCDWSRGREPVRHKNKVYSKWFRHPSHEDIYIGWSTTDTGPMIYRHDPNCGEPLTTYAKNIQAQLNAADSVKLQADLIYEKGPKLTGAKTVDFANARIDNAFGNGWVVVDGGPHTLKNLTLKKKGRAAIWAQNVPIFTVDGFEFANQQFGIITSNNGGEIKLKNGVIRDGWGSEFGQQHNVYVGEIDKVTADNLVSLRHHSGGHLFKSRATLNIIENSRFDGGDSNHSRIFDFSCGGRVEIRNSTMIQSPRSDNRDLIAIAVEACQSPENTLVLENTKWVAARAGAVFLTHKQPVRIICSGTNEFIGVDNPCPGDN